MTPTTTRDAQAQFKFWCDRLHVLDKSLYAVALKGDTVTTTQHLADLRIARAAKLRAFDELQAIRGRAPSRPVQLRPSVRLSPPPPIRRAVPIRASATSTLVLKAVDGGRREISGMASTPTVDRLGDIVEPMGCSFEVPMPLLHHHRSDAPVGEVIAAQASPAGISIRARIAKIATPGLLKDRCDLAWAEIREGLVRGLSIGFRPREHEVLPGGGFKFVKCDVYEVSLVSIPANASARIEAVT
jgi:uncharacterized protein